MSNVKFLDGVVCPRCKMEVTYSIELLQGKEKLICPSCLAEFYPNYMVKQRLKDVVVESPIDESTESEEIKIDAVDNLTDDFLDGMNDISDNSIE